MKVDRSSPQLWRYVTSLNFCPSADGEDGLLRSWYRQRHHAQLTTFANAYAERLIGSIRRECLNHFIVLNAHLKRTLVAYFRYYHRACPHLAVEKQCPIERRIMKQGAIIEIAELGGLHHRYERIAA